MVLRLVLNLKIGENSLRSSHTLMLTDKAMNSRRF